MVFFYSLLGVDAFPIRTASRSFASWPKLDVFPDERRTGRQVFIRFANFQSNTLDAIYLQPLIYSRFYHYSLLLIALLSAGMDRNNCKMGIQRII